MNKAPPSLRFLVLSDIHFGKFAVNKSFGSDDPTQDSSDRMIESLVQTTLDNHQALDAIFVPGDLTSVASPSEFLGCLQIVERIRSELNVTSENLFHTYGNHDVDWQVCNLAQAQFGRGGELEDRKTAEEAYHTIAASIGHLLGPNSKMLTNGPVPGSGMVVNEKFELFVINSGYFCSAAQKHKHGKIGDDQLKWLQQALAMPTDSGKWRIAMTHHHPFNYPYPAPVADLSCIEEGAEIVELLGKHSVDLLVHGHRHHPRLKTHLQDGWARPVTFFCAGSLAVNPHHRDSGRIPNLFHIVDLNSRLQTGGAYGVVTSYEYSSSQEWRPIRNQPETPIDHKQHFGIIATTTDRENAAAEFIRSHVGSMAENKTLILPHPISWPPTLACCHQKDLIDLLKQACSIVGICLMNDEENLALIRS